MEKSQEQPSFMPDKSGVELCEHGNYSCYVCEVKLLKQVIADLETEVKRLQAIEPEIVKLRAVTDKQHNLLDHYGSLLNGIGAETE